MSNANDKRRNWLPALPPIGSDAWRGWNTRSSGSACSPSYLRNCRAAARFFIDGYALPVLEGRKIAFRPMLCRMHRLIVGSLESVPRASYNPQLMSPGITRDRLRGRAAEEARYLLVNFCPLLQHHLNGLRRTFKRGRRHSNRTPPLVGRVGRLVYRQPIDPALECLAFHPADRRLASQVVVTERLSIAVPPQASALPRLLERGGHELRKALSLSPLDTSCSLEARRIVLARLARYYQLMAASHPFRAQNNSLLMNQVNCLLYMHLGGYVNHGALDAWALALPSRAFETIFFDYVRARLIFFPPRSRFFRPNI